MRDLFGHWGIELDEDVFERAVAGRMVEFGCALPKGTAWRSILGGWTTIRRRWNRTQQSAAEFAERWVAFAQGGDLRAVVPDIEKARDEDARLAFEVMRLLGRAKPPFISVVANTAHRRLRVREWGWPLRVGIAQGFDAYEIAQLTWFREFFRVEEAGAAHRPWDILVIPGTLREAVAALATQNGRIRARCLVVTGQEGDVPIGALPSTLASVRALTDGHAVLVARLSGLRGTGGNRTRELQRIAEFLSWTAEELAHDKPLDEALFCATRRSDPGATPLIVGDLPFFDSTPPSRRLRRIADKLVATGRALEADFAPDLPLLGEVPGMERLKAEAPRGQHARPMGRALIEGASEIDWRSESRAATGTARLAEAVKPAFEGAAEKSEARYLHSGMRKWQGAREAEAWVRHLEAAGTYALYVWIGSLDLTALALSAPFPKLPRDNEAHRLDVVLNEPRLLSKPMSGTLLLPPVGESTRCRFLIHCRPGVERIEARIVVLHRGRVIQTGILRGAIGADGAVIVDDGQLRFELDATPRRRLASLSGRSIFGAAIVANHGDDGGLQQLGIVGDRVARIKLGDATLQSLTDRFNAAISDIATAPGKYATLRSEGTIALLRDLAQHGAALHEAIYNHNEVGPALAKEPRLQIVTARVDGFLPLELAYRFEAPEDDATLCEGAEEALSAPLDGAADLGACAAKCGPQPGGTAKRICPMGFWCLWKTIERFEHRTEAIEETADYSLLAEAIGSRPTLPRPSFGLVAASEKAVKYDAGAVDRVVACVKAAFPRGEKVEDWDAWVNEIASSHPGLLVLLPHHVREEGNSLLQIGRDSRLKSTLVKLKHVVGDPPPKPSPKPIILLLGCETQDSAIAIERFPAVFQARGAAVVVATIATVLGRDAAPAAEELVGLLAENNGEERSFGDLLLAARRKLLLKGKAMALALAGFGDADWRLPKGGAYD